MLQLFGLLIFKALGDYIFNIKPIVFLKNSNISFSGLGAVAGDPPICPP